MTYQSSLRFCGGYRRRQSIFIHIQPSVNHSTLDPLWSSRSSDIRRPGFDIPQ